MVCNNTLEIDKMSKNVINTKEDYKKSIKRIFSEKEENVAKQICDELLKREYANFGIDILKSPKGEIYSLIDLNSDTF